MRNRAGRAATAAGVLVVPRDEDPLEAASLKIPRECLHSSMIVTWPRMRLSTVDSLSCATSAEWGTSWVCSPSWCGAVQAMKVMALRRSPLGGRQTAACWVG